MGKSPSQTALEEFLFCMSDQERIVDRAGVGDDKLHPSESQSLQAIDLTAEVFERVFDPDIMGLKKSVELVASSEPQHAPQFILGEMAVLVLFQGQRLQHPTRQVATLGGSEPACEIVGDFYRQMDVAPPSG
jgi:hypothetical protein